MAHCLTLQDLDLTDGNAGVMKLEDEEIANAALIDSIAALGLKSCNSNSNRNGNAHANARLLSPLTRQNISENKNGASNKVYETHETQDGQEMNHDDLRYIHVALKPHGFQQRQEQQDQLLQLAKSQEPLHQQRQSALAQRQQFGHPHSQKTSTTSTLTPQPKEKKKAQEQGKGNTKRKGQDREAQRPAQVYEDKQGCPISGNVKNRKERKGGDHDINEFSIFKNKLEKEFKDGSFGDKLYVVTEECTRLWKLLEKCPNDFFNTNSNDNISNVDKYNKFWKITMDEIYCRFENYCASDDTIINEWTIFKNKILTMKENADVESDKWNILREKICDLYGLTMREITNEKKANDERNKREFNCKVKEFINCLEEKFKNGSNFNSMVEFVIKTCQDFAAIFDNYKHYELNINISNNNNNGNKRMKKWDKFWQVVMNEINCRFQNYCVCVTLGDNVKDKKSTIIHDWKIFDKQLSTMKNSNNGAKYEKNMWSKLRNQFWLVYTSMMVEINTQKN